jgi:hypothetical protein
MKTVRTESEIYEICPVCESDDLEFVDFPDILSNYTHFYDVKCLKCKSIWRHTLKLVKTEILIGENK